MSTLLRSLLALSLTLGIAQPSYGFDLFNLGRLFAPEQCQATVPEVAVTSFNTAVIIDHTTDHTGIERQAPTLVQAMQQGWRTNGLALANLRTDGTIVTREYRTRDGRWCVTLEKVNFLISYDDPIRIMISNRFSKNSCQYQVILEHERQHVEIYEQTLQRHLTDIEPRITERLKATGAGVGDTFYEAKDQVDRAVNLVLTEIADAITMEARVLNAVLDTPSNYAQIQAQCTGW